MEGGDASDLLLPRFGGTECEARLVRWTGSLPVSLSLGYQRVSRGTGQIGGICLLLQVSPAEPGSLKHPAGTTVERSPTSSIAGDSGSSGQGKRGGDVLLCRGERGWGFLSSLGAFIFMSPPAAPVVLST